MGSGKCEVMQKALVSNPVPQLYYLWCTVDWDLEFVKYVDTLQIIHTYLNIIFVIYM